MNPDAIGIVVATRRLALGRMRHRNIWLSPADGFPLA
jgi:hypothetical protein